MTRQRLATAATHSGRSAGTGRAPAAQKGAETGVSAHGLGRVGPRTVTAAQ